MISQLLCILALYVFALIYSRGGCPSYKVNGLVDISMNMGPSLNAHPNYRIYIVVRF